MSRRQLYFTSLSLVRGRGQRSFWPEDNRGTFAVHQPMSALGQKRTSAENERMPQGGLYFCKSNVSQCEHVAGGTDLQPAVILRIHKASVIRTCATVLFAELSFYIANLEWVSGNWDLKMSKIAVADCSGVGDVVMPKPSFTPRPSGDTRIPARHSIDVNQSRSNAVDKRNSGCLVPISMSALGHKQMKSL